MASMRLRDQLMLLRHENPTLPDARIRPGRPPTHHNYSAWIKAKPARVARHTASALGLYLLRMLYNKHNVMSLRDLKPFVDPVHWPSIIECVGTLDMGIDGPWNIPGKVTPFCEMSWDQVFEWVTKTDPEALDCESFRIFFGVVRAACVDDRPVPFDNPLVLGIYDLWDYMDFI